MCRPSLEGYKHKTTLGEKTSGLSERTTSITLGSGQLRGADQPSSSNISNRLTSDSSSSRYNLSFDVKRKHFDGQVHQQQQQQKWILCSPSAEGGVRAVHQLHRQQWQWKEPWHQQQLWQQWQAFLVRCRRLKWRQVFLSFKTSQSFALQLKWRKVFPSAAHIPVLSQVKYIDRVSLVIFFRHLAITLTICAHFHFPNVIHDSAPCHDISYLPLSFPGFSLKTSWLSVYLLTKIRTIG